MQADPAHVRPACQIRPLSDVIVLSPVSPETQTAFLHRPQQRTMPRERFIAVMVVHMRVSTQLLAAR
jgi:hypothetical protein